MSSPKFSAQSELLRYVSEEHRLGGNRTAAAAFLPDPPSANPSKDYLSVNSLEIETMQVIADYHRAKWQNNRGDVALCAHKVFTFNEAGKKSGIDINFDRASSKWQFRGNSAALEDAYKHHPVLGSHNPLNSPSHCGVEFARALKDHAAARFARRLGGKRFHSL